MDKKFWGILGSLTIIAIVLAVIFGGGESTSTNAKPTEHFKGNKTSSITLVEYGDYQCPFCAEYFPIVKQVNAIYDGVIRFQFRNFPLTSIHPNAMGAARAAEAAGKQGKFWEMHDLLYSNSHFQQQTGWTVSKDPLNQYFINYAKELKLNIPKFKKAYADKKINDSILADQKTGDQLGVSGTPAYFLNGKQVKPGISVDSFKEILNKALRKKNIKLPAGAEVSKNPTDAKPEQTKKAQPKS